MTDTILIDGHQDLAWNMLTFGRDYTLPAATTRTRELGTLAVEVNGDTLLGWPDYQLGKVGVIFSTLFAAPARRKQGDWDQECYSTAEEAHTRYSMQLDAYDRLVEEHPNMFRKIENIADLQSIVEHWQRADTDEHPVGLVVPDGRGRRCA
jgi:hypothetical protein